MAAPENTLKAALRAGRMQRGLWLNLGSVIVTEMAGKAGFDWCLIDAEHGPYAPDALLRQLVALEGTGTAPVVRVPVGRDWVLKQVLDLGAQSVLVPMVETAEQAAGLVRAVRYPPEGIRGMGAGVARASGYGAMPGYAGNANNEICLIVQVESRLALSNIEDICAVEGVDAVFVGPADLGADLGFRDDLGNVKVTNAVAEALSRIVASGKPAGIIGFSAEDLSAYARLGATFLGLGSDATLLAGAMRDLARFIP